MSDRERPLSYQPTGHVAGTTGNAWGWTLLPAAAAVLAISAWVFTTAAKGWPVAEA